MADGEKARMLVVEDDRVARDLAVEILRADGYQVDSVGSGEEAIGRAKKGAFDLVLSDVRLGGKDGFEVLAAFRVADADLPVVLITGFGDVAGAIAAIRKGAYDYVPKPFRVDELRTTVRRALERRRLKESAESRPAPPARGGLESVAILGRSAAMLSVYKLVAQVAPTNSTVLIVGESGTGKELVARATHFNSQRSGGPFVAVNCAALAESLLESELFGHEKGAFTGAVGVKRGLFEAAHGGTLFLDELGDMAPRTQAQLLRALEEREIRRVGGTAAIPVDVRVVAATHRDLDAETKAGRFREDLLFRLNVVTVRLPPLRERLEDLELLVAHFLSKHAARAGRAPPELAPEANETLARYSWPGNVRELENVIERAVAISKSGVVLVSDLPPEVTAGPRAAPGGGGDLVADRPTLEELERRYIDLVLQESGGNKKKAAEALGIDRRTLYRMFGRRRAAAPSDDGGSGGGAGDEDEGD
jgi:DNA-binding NtrC family response regulator